MNRLRKLIIFLPLILLFLFLNSCRKFEGDQTIPAYIKIDSISLETDYNAEGANTQKITTIWIYVNNNLEGIYELPVFAPILARDFNQLTLQAGINLNGIAGTRAPYPLYQSIIQDVVFKENSVIDINSDSTNLKAETSYYSNCVFVWKEDFEDPSISLDSIVPSTVDIHRTEPANNPEAFLSENSLYSGYVELDSEKTYFKLATNVGSSEGFELPQANNWPIFLEIDYKCNMPFEVGIYVNEYSQVTENALVGLNASEEWNKIYINLKPIVNHSVNAVDFNIFIHGALPEGMAKGEVYMDNIKLIYRSSQ